MSALPLGGGREPGRGLRWSAAVLVATGLHAGALWWLAGRAFLAPPPPVGAAGVTIDLEPVSVPVAPDAEPKPMENAGQAPEPQVAEAPDAPSEPPPAPAPPEPAQPESQPEAQAPPPPAEQPAAEAAAVPPPEPQVAPPPVEAPPPGPAKPDPAPPPPVPEVIPPAAAAPSEAVPAPPRPAPPKPVKRVAKPALPRPDPRQAARDEAREAREKAREEARHEERAEAAADARAQRRAARAAAVREGGGEEREPAAPRASGASIASWQGEVQARLHAYTPSSPDGNSGTVKVAFSVDRGGRVVSASVSSSSGDPALDQAAVAMVHRASPLPAPPPEMGGRVRLTVPVRFD